jgi:hypothetical protein
MNNLSLNSLSKAVMATILQVLGALGISIGAGFIFPPAGLILAGTFALLFGLALERK